MQTYIPFYSVPFYPVHLYSIPACLNAFWNHLELTSGPHCGDLWCEETVPLGVNLEENKKYEPTCSPQSRWKYIPDLPISDPLFGPRSTIWEQFEHPGRLLDLTVPDCGCLGRKRSNLDWLWRNRVPAFRYYYEPKMRKRYQKAWEVAAHKISRNEMSSRGLQK